jgi:serine/threonine-protein kinase
MTDDPRVQGLLDELVDSDATPEEVCRSCPELLPTVRDRWQRMRRLRDDLDCLFPSPDQPTPQPADEPVLPRIPGYEVEEVLGHGGMGIVFRARHLRLNRPVALKMLLAGGYAGPRERGRFQREAEAVAALRHPNVVQVYDVGDADGRPYFTMELVDGPSLGRKLAGTPQPAGDAAALVATLAGAVQAAHACGIVHRDLKPANVLLTAEGIPKITDFGLARRLDAGAGVTQTGVAMGTPSYMAPEQAVGRPDAVGPATDVYALGAILYELLTGRPPFRAATAAETVRQVIDQEPAPPSRLNDKVQRDLETICLKCLHKEPERRYASAAVLADDLRRLGEGRSIQARPVGWAERSWRWGRRNPAAASALTAAVALLALAIGGGVWFVQQRAERRAEEALHEGELRNEIATAVAQAARLRQGFHFREAHELLEQARQRLEPAGPDDLRRLVHQERADLELAENLDKARLRAAAPVEGLLGPAGAESRYAESLYEQTLAKAGVGGPGDDSKTATARVRDSARRVEIVAALDDWASITADPARRAWLLAVARGADPDPTRDRLRQPELWDDGPGLTKLVNELPVGGLSPQLVSALGRVLLKTGGDAVPLLSAAQARNPQDFWLNFELGWALHVSRRSDEALGFYRAALALRPEASAAHNGVGAALKAQGRLDEAIGHYTQALDIDPNFAMVHHNLGNALRDKGRLGEANSHFEEAIRLDPKGDSVVHYNFGSALQAQGRPDEAISHYQESIRLNPKGGALAHNYLGEALRAKGRLDEAISHYQESIRLNPKGGALAHYNLGNALRDKDRLDEAISHYQESIRLDPKASARAHNGLGLALRAKSRLDEAISHYQESIRLDPKTSATAHFNVGVALQAKGRLDEAIDHYQQCIQLEPTSTVAPPALASTLFQAARADVGAAAGQGSKTDQLSESERADKRRQALARLRANLKLRTKLLNEGKAVAWSVAAWQTDRALASVRDSTALAKLPDTEREQWQGLWADVAAIVAADPLEQGRARAARRDWAGAADGYAQALKSGPTDDGHFWFEYAAVLLLARDRAGYDQACAHMIEKCGKPGGPRAYHVARACTLAPDAVADAGLPGRLAEKELRASAKQFWSLTEQGALAYRAGQFQDAVPLFEQSLKADAKPGRAVVNWVWLALAHQRLGQSDEARRWLSKAQSWLDQYRDGMSARADQELGLHLHNWLEAHVLRREAEALIPPR